MTVELKNDLAIRGTLHSVDQYLNIKLENTRVVDQDKYPHMVSINSFSLFTLLLCICVPVCCEFLVSRVWYFEGFNPGNFECGLNFGFWV